LQQHAHERLADASIAAGHYGDAAFDVHVIASLMICLSAWCVSG
jgi:hypothetical protein